ncbi:CidA/LrgA family protein [Paenibacillus glycanilyticus]|uniref:CidA/LrgA family protein n=1 Tax=Paenibacillus glycanilyticus TaxID=126569 RepID=UPI00203F4DA7|nr:CidA/LrgA family protein [Paenibacillus glycanilyticus]MCM3631090.1 CidA/LrgA family protein [Paenibacillus glycanilyticus]
MRGLAILLGYTLLGNAIHSLLSVPISGNVIGMVLLVVSLFAGWVKLAWIEETAQFFLKHMMIFFAPIIVGTMMFFGVIGDQWFAAAVTLVAATMIVLLVTAGVMAWQSGKAKERTYE